MNNTIISLYLYKWFGVTEYELPRLQLTFALRLLFSVGFIVSFTMAANLWVEAMGSSSHTLLQFFFLDALFALIGGILAFRYLVRGSFIHIMTAAVVGTLLCIILAMNFTDPQASVFLLLIARGIFFAPISTLLYRHAEEVFTPSRAPSIMPLIKSSSTFGVLIGSGLMLYFLQTTGGLTPLWVWVAALIGLLLVSILRGFVVPEIPSLPTMRHACSIHPFADSLKAIKTTPFLRTTALMIPMMMVATGITEYLFTIEVASHAGHKGHEIHDDHHDNTHEKPLVTGDMLQASIITDAADKLHHAVDSAEKAAHTTTKTLKDMATGLFAHESVAHDLTKFHLLFAALSLFFQCFVTPRIIRSKGLISSIVLYCSGVAAVTFGALTGGAGVALLRTFRHGSYSLEQVPYHMSFYSLNPRVREPIRALYEGVLEPFGALVAVLVLLTFGSSALLIMGIIMAYCAYYWWQKRHEFTALSMNALRDESNIESTFQAIETLEQPGHAGRMDALITKLTNPKTHAIVRSKLFESLEEIGDPSVLSYFAAILKNPKTTPEMQHKILEVMDNLGAEKMQKYLSEHVFTAHSLENLMHEYIHSEDFFTRKKAVMILMRMLPKQEMVPFILETIHKADEALRAVYLRQLRHQHDPEIERYIAPYIDSESPRVRTRALMLLWNKGKRDIVRGELYSMLHSKDPEEIISAAYTIGELHDSFSLQPLKSVKTKHEEAQRHIMIARCKVGDTEAIDALRGSIVRGGGVGESVNLWRMSKRLPQKSREHLHRTLEHDAYSLIEKHLHHHGVHKIPRAVRKELSWLYEITGQYDDMLSLQRWG